jgi:hypothetical protein
MLTKENMIAVAKAIVLGADAEIILRSLDGKEKFAVRGAALRALDNLWYDVCDTKQRGFFGHNREEFINQVWSI